MNGLSLVSVNPESMKKLYAHIKDSTSLFEANAFRHQQPIQTINDISFFISSLLQDWESNSQKMQILADSFNDCFTNVFMQLRVIATHPGRSSLHSNYKTVSWDFKKNLKGEENLSSRMRVILPISTQSLVMDQLCECDPSFQALILKVEKARLILNCNSTLFFNFIKLLEELKSNLYELDQYFENTKNSYLDKKEIKISYFSAISSISEHIVTFNKNMAENLQNCTQSISAFSPEDFCGQVKTNTQYLKVFEILQNQQQNNMKRLDELKLYLSELTFPKPSLILSYRYVKANNKDKIRIYFEARNKKRTLLKFSKPLIKFPEILSVLDNSDPLFLYFIYVVEKAKLLLITNNKHCSLIEENITVLMQQITALNKSIKDLPEIHKISAFPKHLSCYASVRKNCI